MAVSLPPIDEESWQDHNKEAADRADAQARADLERAGRLQEEQEARRQADRNLVAAQQWEAATAPHREAARAGVARDLFGQATAPLRAASPPGGGGETSAGAVSPGLTGRSGDDRYRTAARGAFGDLGEDVVENMARIGELESTGNASARYVTPKEDSRGFWQINTLAHPQLATKYDLNDPAQNALAAREVYDRQGYGAWYNSSKRLGLDTTPGAPATRPRPAPAAPAMPEYRAPVRAEAVGQFEQGLPYDEAASICGPVAALAFAQANGRNPDLGEARRLAARVGWTAQGGMNGVANEQRLLEGMGVASRLDTSPDFGEIAADAASGNPVIVSTGRHYYYVNGYDPATGRLRVGKTGEARRGGSAWMSAQQIAELDGGINGVLYVDNPRSPAPSVAVATSPEAQKAVGPTGPASQGGPYGVGAGTDDWRANQGRFVQAVNQPPAGPDVGPPTAAPDVLGLRVREGGEAGAPVGMGAPAGADAGPYPGSLPPSALAPPVGGSVEPTRPTRRERVRSALEDLTDALIGDEPPPRFAPQEPSLLEQGAALARARAEEQPALRRLARRRAMGDPTLTPEEAQRADDYISDMAMMGGGLGGVARAGAEAGLPATAKMAQQAIARSALGRPIRAAEEAVGGAVRQGLGAARRFLADEAGEVRLPPLVDNFLKPLRTYADRLYHETNAAGVDDFLPLPGKFSRLASEDATYLANSPDLALGQGANRGILLEFDAGNIQGQVNTSKPMWRPAYEQGDAEFVARLNEGRVYEDALRSVTVKPDLQGQRADIARLKRVTLPRLEEAGWTKTANPDGSVTYARPGAAPAGLPPDAAPGQGSAAGAAGRFLAEEAGELRLPGGRSRPVSEETQTLLDFYRSVGPDRAARIRAAAVREGARRLGVSTEQAAATLDEIEALLPDVKTISHQVAPYQLRNILQDGRLGSKFNTGLTEDEIVEATAKNVAGNDVTRFTRAGFPATPEGRTAGAADFLERQRQANELVTGERDLGAPFARITEGQTLPDDANGLLYLVMDESTPRLTAGNHHFAFGSPGYALHDKMPDALKRVLWGTNWRQKMLDVGDGRRVIDTEWMVGPEQENTLRAATLLMTAPDDVVSAVKNRRLGDPADLAAAIVRGSKPRGYRPMIDAAKRAGMQETDAGQFDIGASLNANRSESLLLDPDLGDVRAIYVVGNDLDAVFPGTSGIVGRGGLSSQRAAELVQQKIKDVTGKDVPIVRKDITTTGSKLAPEGLSAAGRGPLVERYTGAGFPDIGVRSPDVLGAVGRGLRAPPAANVAGAVAGGVAGYETTPEGATPLETALHVGAGALAGSAGVNVARGALRGGLPGAVRGLGLDTGIGRRLGAVAGEGERETVSAGFRQGWDRARNVIARQGPAGKELAGLIDLWRERFQPLQGDWVTRMPTVRALNKTDFRAFVDAAEGKAEATTDRVKTALAEWSSVRDEVYRRAKALNLDIGRLENYWPHMFEEGAFKGKNWSDALDHLVRTGQAADRGEAAAMLRYARDVRRNRRYGNLEAERLADLDTYRRDKGVLFGRGGYLEQAAERITQVETFGDKDERAMDLIARIAKSGHDAGAARELFDISVGAKRYGELASNLSGKLRASNSVMQLGLAALGNAAGQVNNAAVLGLGTTARRMLQVLAQPALREEARRAGVILDNVVDEAREGQGIGSRALRRVTAPLFGPVETWLRATAYHGGIDYAEDAAARAAAGDVSAQNRLVRLGLPANRIAKRGVLTEEERMTAGRRMVQRTQGLVAPQDLPGWADSPGGKLLTQFKRFPYTQSAFLGREIIGPALRREDRDLAPLARFMIAGLLGGAAITETKNLLQFREPEEDPAKRILQYYAAVGGLGLVGDVLRVTSPLININAERTDPDRVVTQAVGTVLGPTVGAGIEGLSGVAQLTRGNAVPLLRSGLRRVPVVGTTLQNLVVPYRPREPARTAPTSSRPATPPRPPAPPKPPAPPRPGRR